MIDVRESAVRFTMGVLRHAADWQEGQHALAQEERFAPICGDLTEAQAIIREAEERLGDQLPY